MICPTCHGTRWVPVDRGMLRYVDPAPCPDCIGGAAYCCDGDQACPEDKTEAGDRGE